ncbi:preprotein translocase subunit SecG [bacterium]|nr:preprotein translocase subunit SecG [Candidatus Celaenobacter polaris]TSA23536.1 MAG: preprotein translocase subunit SecG [bacterium]
MYTILLIIHVIVCIALVVSVLLQSSKGGGLGGAFGGGGGDTLFGGQTASNFLKKTTRVLGVSFMVITILLALTLRTTKFQKEVGQVSEELQKEIDETDQTPQEIPATLPEGFEVIPEESGTQDQ